MKYAKQNKLLIVALTIIAVIFNPFIQIYLHNKSFWLPLDFFLPLIVLAYLAAKNKKIK